MTTGGRRRTLGLSSGPRVIFDIDGSANHELAEYLVAAIRIQPASVELAAGQLSRIPIIVSLDKALKVRGLHATFHGAEETRATYATYNAATKSTQTHTAVQHVDIVKTEFVLSGRERKGFFGNVADGLATIVGGGDHDVLGPGEYPFEVEVHLPPDAPSSFEGKKCRVFYEISTFIDVPMWRDVKARQAFQVQAAAQEPAPGGPVRTRYPEDQHRGLLDALMSPEIRVEAALTEQSLREGDTVEGIFAVETSKPLEYRAISVRLVAMERASAEGHADSYTHTGDPVRIAAEGVIDGKYSQQFCLPASNPGAMTAAGRFFSIECFVQIELDVPWAKDPSIRVPVTLR